MPALSLVICLHREGTYLARMLDHAQGCYDDLVVVHDGVDEDSVRAPVEARGGRFFERPRAWQQEPHWPFAWGQARHDWILRWDADDLPSEALANWLRAFRLAPEPHADISAFSCVYPLWDGRKARTHRWPHRICLFHRQRVRHFGMADQSPIPDGRVVPLDLVLRHEPERPSYGVWYILRRPTSRRWHEAIAQSLQGKPTDLPCWRWTSSEWPPNWQSVRRHPLRTGLRRLFTTPVNNACAMLRHGEWPHPSMLVSSPLQHWMTCYRYWQMNRVRTQTGDNEGNERS